MISSPNDGTRIIKEYIFAAMIALAVWLKFISVDYAAADVLDWPVFGLTSLRTLRYMFRALAVSLPSLGAILALMIPLYMLLPRRRIEALLVVDLLLSCLAQTDRLFIRYYADIFIFHDLMLLPQTGLIAKSIWALLRPWDFLLLADLPIFIWLLKSGRVKLARTPRGEFAKRTAVLFMLAIAVQCAAAWNFKSTRPSIAVAMYDRLSVCAWTSAATFHWWDFFSLAEKALEPKDVDPNVIKEIDVWLAARAREPKAATKAKNLILIQCEALQYFVVDLEIGGVPATPNLNKFKNECLYFPNTWSQVAAGNSADAEFMANTGLYPAAYGAAYSLYADNDYRSLARAMRLERGARAVVVQGTKSAFWNCHRMHPQLWFHKQYSQNTYPRDEVIGLGLSDKAIFSRALEVFKTMKSPFYGFIVTLTSHHPFDFTEIPRNTLPLPPELEGTLIGNYLLSINYFDKQFGNFMTGLKEAGLLDKSLIVVYGDHPAIPIAYKAELERLLKRPIATPSSWRATRRIPLFFRVPERVSSPEVDSRDVGQIDILPTVAGIMGLDIPTAFGNDLLKADSPHAPVIFRNGSYVLDGVYVEPAAGFATDMRDGSPLNVSSYDAITDEVERSLKYSDLILTKNLIEKLSVKR